MIGVVALLSISAEAAFLTRFGSARTLPAPVKEVYTSRFRLEGVQTGSSSRLSKGAAPPPTEAVVAGLWAACITAYGSEELALRAVTQNPTILNPLYTDPPSVIANSKRALVQVLGGEEEAIDVMLKNPAVLQCGSALTRQQAGEIRSFAAVRQLLDSSPPWAPKVTLALIFAALSFEIALQGNPEADPLLAVIKPTLGALGASIFGLTLASFVRVSLGK
mmetsp:Transcript_25908/g.83698  ORF Transcript_25908/g.83698 Transcript_25908/m.83698 type:complete len:220 (-) Transcript_25908:119-778(-)